MKTYLRILYLLAFLGIFMPSLVRADDFSSVKIEGNFSSTTPLLSLKALNDAGTAAPLIAIYSSSGHNMFSITENNGNDKGILKGVESIDGLSQINLSSSVAGYASAININSQNLLIGYDASRWETFLASYSYPLVFRTNPNVERMRIGLDGTVAIGTTTPAAYLHVASPAITALNPNMFRVTGTLDMSDPSAPAGTSRIGGWYVIETTGSGPSEPIGLAINMNPGYTGPGKSRAFTATNSTAGVKPFNPYTESANMGGMFASNGGGADNVGVYTLVGGAKDLNIGYYSRLTGTPSGPVSVGYLSSVESGTTYNIGGYFGLSAIATTSLNVSAAIVGDNGWTGKPIFVGRVNNVTKDVIDGQGRLGLGTTSPSEMLSVEGNGLFSDNVSASSVTVAASSTNATSTLQVGKPGQNKGSCLVMYDETGAVQYVTIRNGAFVLSSTACN